MSPTATDGLGVPLGFCGASAQRCFDFGWVLTNRLPEPMCLISCTTFQLLYCLNFASFWIVGWRRDQRHHVGAQVARGPDRAELGWKLAPRPGWGIFLVSTRAASLPVLVSTTAAILFGGVGATRK